MQRLVARLWLPSDLYFCPSLTEEWRIEAAWRRLEPKAIISAAQRTNARIRLTCRNWAHPCSFSSLPRTPFSGGSPPPPSRGGKPAKTSVGSESPWCLVGVSERTICSWCIPLLDYKLNYLVKVRKMCNYSLPFRVIIGEFDVF